jgi:DNA-binding response OmpR family regulator
MKVLLADSDDLFLETLQSFLWDHGHEAEIAGDAMECMTVLREFTPDSVVLADELPGGGADGVIVQTREDSTLSQTAVILMSHKKPQEELESLASSVAIGRLQRPFGLSELLSQLDSIERTARSTKNGAALSLAPS